MKMMKQKCLNSSRNNKISYFIIAACLLVLTQTGINNAVAEETTLEKVESAKNKSVDSVKKTYRKADDKVCEIINGVRKCYPKKVKNKLKNTIDKLETDSTEAINKID